MKIRIILIFLLAIVFCAGLIATQSLADLSSANYQIKGPVIGAGGATEMSSSNYKLMDVKSFYGGVLSGTNNTIQLGGIYLLLPLLEETAPTSEGLVDNGLIINTNINRIAGDDIEISFSADPSVISANVYQLSGLGAEFSSTATWSKVNREAIAINRDPAVNSGKTVWRESDSADVDRLIRSQDGNNAYYRVVPALPVELAPPAPANIFGSAPAGKNYNDITVGKIDLAFAANDLKLVSMPLLAGPMSSVLSGQRSLGQFVLYPQSGGGLNVVSYNGGIVGDFDVSPAVGFWFQNDSNAKVVTFVGRIINSATKSISNIELSVNPLPYGLSSRAIGGLSGDVIYPQSGGGLNVVNNSAGWASEFNLGIGSGFWYQSPVARLWRINLISGASITRND